MELSPKRLLEVQLPVGTQLAKDPSTICDAAIVEPADPRRFNCLVPPLAPRERREIAFEVKITGPITGTGTVTTRAFGPGTDLDTNRANDTASITITGVYDIMAIGATVNGKVGSVVQITAGVKNLGPASSPEDENSLFSTAHIVIVELPVGTELAHYGEAAQYGSDCSPTRYHFPNHPRRFNCRLSVLEAGQSYLVTFRVRITAPVSASGSVIRDLFYGPDHDTNRDNDVAAITFTNEELPQTGTDAKTIAGLGAGSVVLGGLLLLVLRRFGWRREQRMHRLS